MKKIIIIGAGPAGMMAAIAASREGNQVIIFERNEKSGKKLFITGKGRCNVTNACEAKELQTHVVTNPKFLYSAFSRFSNQDMIDFLKEQGVETRVERGQRVFPVSDHSSDIIRALREACKKRGVDIRLNTRVHQIFTKDECESPESPIDVSQTDHASGVNPKNHNNRECEENRPGDNNHIPQTNQGKKNNTRAKRFAGVVLENGQKIKGDVLILATGGCSYQSTGSTGDGYSFAKETGHTIKTPEPSLVPFDMKETWCQDLMGLSLKNVSVRIAIGKKTIYQGFGEMLFTHFGVSGPLILTASTRLGKNSIKKAMEEGKLTLTLDLKPALDIDQLEKRFLREFDTWRNKNISNVIEQMLPKRLVPIFLEIAEVPGDKKVRDISRAERRRMVETMKAVPMHIKGVRGFEEAIITRGGVHVKEIDPSTMESKIVKNLYFAGEIIDVDAETGGYNLQIAWSTGYTAGLCAGTPLTASSTH